MVVFEVIMFETGFGVGAITVVLAIGAGVAVTGVFGACVCVAARGAFCAGTGVDATGILGAGVCACAGTGVAGVLDAVSGALSGFSVSGAFFAVSGFRIS